MMTNDLMQRNVTKDFVPSLLKSLHTQMPPPANRTHIPEGRRQLNLSSQGLQMCTGEPLFRKVT